MCIRDSDNGAAVQEIAYEISDSGEVSAVLKVAAYARVSTDKDDQINSLTNQREYFESYIKSKGDWEFVEVYFDEGITGTQTKKRKGVNRMINDLSLIHI